MHYISGLIAETSRLRHLATSLALAPPAPLEFGLAFLTVDNDDVIRIAGESSPIDVGYDSRGLDAAFIPIVLSLSAQGAILYVQTDYWGGSGEQGALLAENGRAVFGPEHRGILPGPISRALALMGVVCGPEDFDEFEAVGLERHRSNDGWREVAIEEPGRS